MRDVNNLLTVPKGEVEVGVGVLDQCTKIISCVVEILLEEILLFSAIGAEADSLLRLSAGSPEGTKGKCQ